MTNEVKFIVGKFVNILDLNPKEFGAESFEPMGINSDSHRYDKIFILQMNWTEKSLLHLLRKALWDVFDHTSGGERNLQVYAT